MKERPILFQTDMVQAILEGRKTVTRRVIKMPDNPFPENWRFGRLFDGEAGFYNSSNDRDANIKCPYGVPGDLLYVRETFIRINIDREFESREIEYAYRASLSDAESKYGQIKNARGDRFIDSWKWKPSIHMPKEAARIWLEVKNIRVERVQDITANEIKKEGVDFVPGWDSPDVMFAKWIDLWDSINEKRGFGWESNPWVWVVDFELISTTGKPEDV